MKKLLTLSVMLILTITVMCITVSATTVSLSTNTGWNYNEATSTLTLTNYKPSKTVSGEDGTCQIYSDGDLHIVLEGTSTLDLKSAYGIYVAGHLTISGTGTLNITKATNGIYAVKNITIQSGTVSAPTLKANGGNITIASGTISIASDVIADNANITIDNGTVTAKKLSAKNITINDGEVNASLYVSNGLVINNGKVTADTVRQTGWNYDGFCYIKNGNVTISKSFNFNSGATFSGGEIYIGNKNNTARTFHALKISGGKVTIVGGLESTLIMTGGTASITGMIQGDGKFTLSGGTLAVKGYIRGNGGVNISGGTLTLESNGDGIYSGEYLTITGGKISISSKEQALRASKGLSLPSGNCFAIKTGSSAANAQDATQYYGEKHISITNNHIWAPATCARAEHCSVCKTYRDSFGPLDYTNHESSNIIYSKNETGHIRQHECCKIEVDRADHTWNSVVTKEPTSEANGVKTHTCTVCSYTKTEIIDKLPPNPTPSAQGNTQTNYTLTVIVGAVCLCAGLAVGLVTGMIIGRKKK